MMHEPEKSDLSIVAEKPTNKAGQPAAEPAEPREGTERNTDQQSTYRTQRRERVSQALERVRQAAGRDRTLRLAALLHHVTIDLLWVSFEALKRDASAGVDGVTWHAYAQDLGGNLAALHDRVHRGAYRALPSRRQYIPKPDDGRRPLGIAALEDKIVQQAVATVLSSTSDWIRCASTWPPAAPRLSICSGHWTACVIPRAQRLGALLLKSTSGCCRRRGLSSGKTARCAPRSAARAPSCCGTGREC